MANIGNCFDFQTVMDATARANQFVLDDNQRHIISRLDALMMPLFNPGQVKKTFDGVYIRGKVGRGKSFIVDTFFSAVPVNKMRVHGLPLPACTPLPLAVGYRIIDLLSPALDYLHLSFEALCVAPTAVMDYLMFCKQHRSWIIEGAPALAGVSLATQQRFINVIDVLYDQNCRLFLISEHTLEEMTEGAEQEDIQRTRSRLNQLKHYVLSHSSHHDNGLGRN